MARKHSVALQDHIGTGGVFLQGEANALYQVLTNLIRNAVRASQHRRVPVTITLQRSDQDLRLIVEDQGMGIPPQQLPRIFDPGFTTQEFGSGSGMGLSVVRQLTEDMFGGRVEVVSTPGAGSTFTIVLPIPPQRTTERDG